jgi:hypothetical protein
MLTFVVLVCFTLASSTPYAFILNVVFLGFCCFYLLTTFDRFLDKSLQATSERIRYLQAKARQLGMRQPVSHVDDEPPIIQHLSTILKEVQAEHEAAIAANNLGPIKGSNAISSHSQAAAAWWWSSPPGLTLPAAQDTATATATSFARLAWPATVTTRYLTTMFGVHASRISRMKSLSVPSTANSSSYPVPREAWPLWWSTDAVIAVRVLNAREQLLAQLQDLRMEHANMDPQLHQVKLVAERLRLRSVLASTTRQGLPRTHTCTTLIYCCYHEWRLLMIAWCVLRVVCAHRH